MKYLSVALFFCLPLLAGAQSGKGSMDIYFEQINQKLDERNALHDEFLEALQKQNFQLAEQRSNHIMEYVPKWHRELRNIEPYLSEPHFLPAVWRLADYDLNSHKSLYPNLIALMKIPTKENVENALQESMHLT